MRPTRTTNLLEKVLASIINLLITGLVCFPFVTLSTLSDLHKKVIFLALFFLYSVAFIIFNKGRDIGMMVVNSYWKDDYPVSQQLIFAVLYTASFATLFFSIFFPFDLFLANILLLQVPTYMFTGTTFHGWLAGGMISVMRGSDKRE